ncbi:MAG: ATP-dependent DNA ligase [Rhodobacteraceae bacterium]|nr:ATP-dependent DNA ligase [Paracoccaceae bacterium]
MKRFAALFAALDGTTRTSAKVAALADYFREAPEADRLWTVALLSGRRPKRSVSATRLAGWAAERAGLPEWLFADAYAVAGDLAETIALILPEPARPAERSLAEWIAEVRALAALPEEEKKPRILAAWEALGGTERFLFNKLLTGGFRMGVSQTLMTRALAQATGIPEPELAHRLMGDWSPERTSWASLVLADDPAADLSRPYPFCLAYQIEGDPAALGPPADWFAEWKWDGIRGQLILRGGAHHLWSRGEELITDRFPELAGARDLLPPGTVIDGEVLAFAGGRPLPFAQLQRRIGRKSVPRSVLAEAPVVLMAYDLLEAGGADIRQRPFAERRARLAALLAALPPEAPLRLSPEAVFDDWAALARLRERSRAAGAEGLMLKRRAAPYLAGRRKGDWWKWKVDPFSIDAVMVYAQAGHGRRANLYTDFTFAVWDGDDLVPFTRAYSGLTDAEFARITAWVRKNTLERFGPVRRVRPEHVFEIGFEGIQRSSRHRSGVALRFPRMLRWREDKPAAEASTLADLRALLDLYG